MSVKKILIVDDEPGILNLFQLTCGQKAMKFTPPRMALRIEGRPLAKA